MEIPDDLIGKIMESATHEKKWRRYASAVKIQNAFKAKKHLELESELEQVHATCEHHALHIEYLYEYGCERNKDKAEAVLGYNPLGTDNYGFY